MTANLTIDLAYCFRYSHFETGGKLENIYDCLDSFDDLIRIGLDLTNGRLDDLPLELSEIRTRAARAKTAITHLRKRGYAPDLILPGLLSGSVADPAHRDYLKKAIASAATTGARTIWLDDRWALSADPTETFRPTPALCHAFARHARLTVTPKRLLTILTTDEPTPAQQKIKTAWFRFLHHSLLQACRTARKAIASPRRIHLGIIAAPPEYYHPYAATAAQLAAELNSPGKGNLAQCQSFPDDYRRTAVLDAASRIATACADNHAPHPLGFIHHNSASPFHKSVEATQMQINLNILHGVETIMLDPFDELGSAPYEENPYLQMFTNAESFWSTLAAKLPRSPQLTGLTVITAPCTPEGISPRSMGLAAYCPSDPWPTILSRLGFPVRQTCASDIDPTKDADTMYILTGDTPLSLNRKQLDHIFSHGVLLDAYAAETIQHMKHSQLLGLTVHGPLPHIHAEILSDAAFMHSSHGHRSIFKGVFEPTDLRRLEPVHPHTRIVSTLLPQNDLPNIPGIVLFDNIDKSQRSATLPYSFARASHDHLLDPVRQQHLHNVLTWLLRRRLPCFVENAPDLIPFYLPAPRRIILALLNVGFDWAIDSRIRLGRLPFKVKRVRELNDQGKLITEPGLKIKKLRDYQYIQLTSDTAVPPMQMTTFILEP